jgi:hypothetical protein
MSTSFLTNASIAVATGFLVVASQAFASPTTAWIAFGIAIGVLVVSCLAQTDASRGRLQRTLDGVIAVVSAWTIVASVVFHGATVRWLSTGEALALVALGIAGLTYNEVREQKAVRAASGTGMGESLRAAA